MQCILYFFIKTAIFKVRPLLRFLCLINSFYRRYVCCIHNRSNGSNRSNRFSRSNRSNRFSISHYFLIISLLCLIISLLFPHYFVTILHYFPRFLYYFLLFPVIPPLFHTILTILGFHSCVCKSYIIRYNSIKFNIIQYNLSYYNMI